MDSGAQGLWEVFRQLRDQATRERLVEHYMPLAKILAAKMYGMRLDDSSTFDDYLQFARLGLIESVSRYDPSRSASFETYSSYRIRGAILNGIEQSSEASAQRTFWRGQSEDRLQSIEQSLPAPAERATLTHIADLAVDLAIGLVLEGASEVADEDPRANPYAVAELANFTRLLKDLVRNLPVRERELIEAHYFEQTEFQVLAQRFAVTKGRVSQLHARALERLREMMRDRPNLDRKL